MDNLMETIVKLTAGTQIQRAEDCSEMERIIGADICGTYNPFLPPNTLHIEEDGRGYIIMLRDGELKRLDLSSMHDRLFRPVGIWG